MTKRSYELIVPTIAETRLTGYQGGIQKEYRGHIYSVSFTAGAALSCKKDGKDVAWLALPPAVRKVAHEGAAALRDAFKLSEAAK